MRTMRTLWWALGAPLAGAAGVLLLHGCGVDASGDLCTDKLVCPDDGGPDATGPDAVTPTPDAGGGDARSDSGNAIDGGDGGGRDGGGDAPTCDPTKAPSEDPCVINDAQGIFVSPMGHANGAGTKADPVNAIGLGITLAKAQNKRVYVCVGSYDEHLSLTAATDGAQVFGALACADWSYGVSNKVTVSPGTTGYALQLDGLVTGARFEDVGFTAKDAMNAGESSIAVFANNAQNVVLRRAQITAGKGIKGADGSTQSNYTPKAPDDAAIAGHDATNAMGGAVQTCSALCSAGGTSTGGLGGNGGDGTNTTPSTGGNGQPNLGGLPPNDGAGGNAALTAVPCGNGHPGASSPDATGGAGATSVGSLDTNGWHPANGGVGSIAGVAQGGGGGGGGISASKGGAGGGGCGGCGGGGGSAGQGGGASVGVVSVNSALTLDTCKVQTNAAGDGGKGGDGQDGETGGNGGSGPPPGCNGGNGGTGGKGGGGGGGAGGVSITVAYKGTAPSTANSTLMPGQAGNGGGAGKNGGATSGINGIAGTLQAF